MATYNGNLVSFLAIQEMTLPFTTLQEAVGAVDYRIRINTCSVYATLFQVNNFPYQEPLSRLYGV